MPSDQPNPPTPPRLLLRYPELATSQLRWDTLLGCIASHGGPTTWEQWRETIRPLDAFADVVGKDLTGRFGRWRKGERKAFTFLQKMAALSPVADVLGDHELAWSAYWLESGCEPVSARGMKAVHVFPEAGGSAVLVTEPGEPESQGGPNIHDKRLAVAHMQGLLPKRRRDRPKANEAAGSAAPQVISDGRFDFPPWFHRHDFQHRADLQDLENWKMWKADYETKTGNIITEPRPAFPDVSHEIDDSIRAYGRGALGRVGVYFKGEPWADFSPMAKQPRRKMS